MKKLIVTGGAGFIGSWLVKFLIKTAPDYKIIVIDNLNSGSIDNLLSVMDKIDFEKLDIRDSSKLSRIVYNADAIFHLAAIPSVFESIEKPFITNDINLNGTVNLLNISIKSKVKSFIFSSSSAIYGNPVKIPLSENDLPERVLSPYALQKKASEEYCNLFFETYGLRTINLRYFNVYGPNQNPNSEYTAVITKFMTNSINNKALTIFGDGKQTRDFIYVTDIARANWLAFKQAKGGETYNIGTGKSISINELAKKIIKISNKKIAIKYESPRKGDILHSCANIKKAQTQLGFEPKISIEEGLIRLYSSIE